MRPRLSVIVPFHRGLAFLERVLKAISPLPSGDELIVVADGAVEEYRPLASALHAIVMEIGGPRGPAAARNAAAARATGDILMFVDADVVASLDALERVARLFAARPELSAIFGAYDEAPAAAGFVSEYKNLAHSFVHQAAAGPAETFWAGFGAVRRTAFLAVGGFDERFERPSIEDIDLGYRLTAAGHRILLDASLTVCHLKQWTTWGMIKSDVVDRGIPWTQLILRYGRFGGQLNARGSYRACVVVAYLALGAAALAAVDTRSLVVTAALIGALLYLGADYYRFFWRKRGAWFAARVVPLHFLYHLYNGVSFVAGTALFLAARHLGVAFPAALPAYAMNSGSDHDTAVAAVSGVRRRPENR